MARAKSSHGQPADASATWEQGIFDMKQTCCWLLFSLAVSWAPVTASEFPGWQALRVIKQDGRPYVLRTGDLDGSGHDQLIVVNNRSSRLDIYSWLAEDKRETTEPTQPNELPMAPELKHSELQLEHIPRDVLVQDLDGDDQAELIILVSPPTQLLIYARDDQGEWKRESKYDLLNGDIASKRQALLLRELQPGKFQLLVSFDDGIQHLVLEPGSRAKWFTPREESSRSNWWLADLDGDGHQDLIEQTKDSSEPVRWYRGSAAGKLAPAATLFDRSVSDVEVMRNGDSVELALLDGSVRQLLRRYRLDFGEPSPFGLRRPLAMADASKTAWCGMWQGEKRALVAADRKRPQLLTYRLDESGWSAEEAFPAVSGIEALESPAAEPGTVLIWAKDASDLLVSNWQSQRLTYPRPMQQSAETEDRKILALSSVGETTWWVQKVDKDLDLYRWQPGQPQAEVVRFEKAGAKPDEVLWIGGDRLLLKETHSRGLKLVTLKDGETKITSPTHLKKASLTQYRLLALGDETRLGRLVEGVLQWIGDDLQSHDQVMLPQGQELADYVATGTQGGWALEEGSDYVHRIKIEESGLSQAAERVKIGDGIQLKSDTVLGFLLLDHDRITQLSEGRPYELKLVEAIDKRVARAGGVRETKFHRLGAADIDGDGYDDLLLFDELEHRITVLADKQGQLQPKISWPVFDDKVYPYGDEYESLVHEPRAAVALDIDGDGQQDLAMLSQDRLLIYLAREEQP